jgi:hypothetical protein
VSVKHIGVSTMCVLAGKRDADSPWGLSCSTKPENLSECVCVCVCVCKREREKKCLNENR